MTTPITPTPATAALTAGPETPPGILAALHSVMAEIKAVGKEGWNNYSNYNFRGIDGVLNAVGPALRQHRVVLIPTVEHIDYDSVPAKGGAMMTAVRLQMRVALYAMDGSSIAATVWGEAFDSGDKATAKAHSVALRTALIQMLALPTQEPDPDETTYERRNANMTDEQMLADAETADSLTLARMVQQAQHDGNRPLYDGLVKIGKRRFPPKNAPAPAATDGGDGYMNDQDNHN